MSAHPACQAPCCRRSAPREEHYYAWLAQQPRPIRGSDADYATMLEPYRDPSQRLAWWRTGPLGMTAERTERIRQLHVALVARFEENARAPAGTGARTPMPKHTEGVGPLYGNPARPA